MNNHDVYFDRELADLQGELFSGLIQKRVVNASFVVPVANPFFGKTILVTGGTGFIGSAFCKHFLDAGARKVISFSRRWDAAEKLQRELNNDRFRVINGDITNYQQVLFATKDVDIILHAAAYKAVDYAEYNSQYVTSVNVNGSINVINAAIENNVKAVFGISSDKACNAINTYGRTKSLMESLFVNANNLGKTLFSVARYANVLGSTGSVIPKFVSTLNDGAYVNITNPSMTRFFFDQATAVKFVINSMIDMLNNPDRRGLVYVPVMKSCTIGELADAAGEIMGISSPKHNVIGVRAGEKMHESMIAEEEVAYEYNGNYLIYPSVAHWGQGDKRGNPLSDNSYTSYNAERFTKEELIDTIFDTVKQFQ